MARRTRKPVTQSAIPRTIERIAIAALAAIATRGSSESIALVAITIFVVVVIVEELGRRWVWHGKKVTLRDVALGSVGELRLWRAERRVRRKRRWRGSRAGRGRSDKPADQGHALRGAVSE